MRGGMDRSKEFLMLSVVFMAPFMDGLDIGIVSVAMPNIASSLNVDIATVSWVSIVYLMVISGTLVFFAKKASNVGIRKIMTTGIVIFTAGSLFCGLSPNYLSLISAIVVQSIGASMMAATSPMICSRHLPIHRLGFGLSVLIAGSSFGYAIGPILGGSLLEFVDWHFIFFINVPIGILLALIAARAIPGTDGTGEKEKVDAIGTVLLMTGVMCGIFAIEMLSQSDTMILPVTFGIVCLALICAFTVWERRTENPLLNVSMFRSARFSAGFLCLMLTNMFYLGIFYLIPFYGEIALDMSAFTVGVYLFISSMITCIFGMPVAKYSDRKGRKKFCVAAGLINASVPLLLGVFADDMTIAVFLLAMIMMGFGWTFVGGPMASRMIESAGDNRNMASALTNEAYRVGGAIGTATAATLFTIFSGSRGTDISSVSVDTFLTGFVPVMAILVAICILIALISFILKESPDQSDGVDA